MHIYNRVDLKELDLMKGKVRLSNFELLRIISMLMILVLHANFWAIGAPDAETFDSSPISAITRTLIEMISIVSVNVFVMISGWFGIRATMKSFGNFVFQCLFFLIGIYVVMLLLGLAPISAKGVAGCFALTKANWFIKAYLGLFFISPVLNTFLEHCSKRQLEYTLVSFYIFQTIYGCSGIADFICNGYSVFSFIGLYLLARYLRLYGNSFYKYGGGIYSISVFLNVLLFYFMTWFGVSRFDVIGYANLLVVMGAAGLIMWTAQLKIRQSSFINFIAASSFAVFLLHANPNIGEPMYKPFMNFLYGNFNGLACLMVMFMVLVSLFALAIVLDQPRKWLWRMLWNRIEQKY